MNDTSPDYIEVGAPARRIALLRRPGRGPTVVWLGGFRSDMRATKATELDRWAARTGRPFLRMDYSAHGESPGRFEDCTVSIWLEDALAVIGAFAGERPVLVGSSMGGWIALLATAALMRERPAQAPGGLVLIAPAVDFTERMWASMPDEGKRAIAGAGVWYRPSAYSDEPYPISRKLIDDGRKHLMLGRPISTGCPVHILQGMQDPDVPWAHAMEVVEHLPGDSVSLTLVKDGDHRLSRPQDIERLVGAVEAMVAEHPRA
ncbi:alpha/beta hydrolase [Chelatococcus reniformis]|uniref:alpha/beta hydrolase n=1 Tax=Chelatococcus reniformis TaxID=1494448 RepID=UPI001FCF05D6|nr:alpha/beta hydrolase [Chelatococcus reniformis]